MYDRWIDIFNEIYLLAKSFIWARVSRLRLFEFILFKPFCLTITNKRPYITYRRTQQTNNYVILTEKHNTINNYINTLFNYFSSNNIAKKKQNERSIRKHATSNRE